MQLNTKQNKILFSTMADNKSLSEKTTAELIETYEKHAFFLKLLAEELKKRGVVLSDIQKQSSANNTSQSTTPAEKKPVQLKKTIVVDIKPEDKKKEKAFADATIADMKHILTLNKIEFKTAMKKDELIQLVRKNNLVRKVEQYINSD